MANTEGQKKEENSSKPDENKMGGEVTAAEDLMREHGVLRRALLVYSAAAANYSAIACAQWQAILLIRRSGIG